MAIVASRETYFARATLTKSGAWILSFAEWPEIEVFVSDIRHAENAAREQIAATLGRRIDAFEVQVHLGI
jgi:hypothetical protein